MKFFHLSDLHIGLRMMNRDLREDQAYIFDIEKTVADIIYYRNKVGMEETSEILKKYLGRKGRQIDRLYEYAKKLRCEKTIRTYLEVLI